VRETGCGVIRRSNGGGGLARERGVGEGDLSGF
jgi:hypothetical protein